MAEVAPLSMPNGDVSRTQLLCLEALYAQHLGRSVRVPPVWGAESSAASDESLVSSSSSSFKEAMCSVEAYLAARLASEAADTLDDQMVSNTPLCDVASDYRRWLRSFAACEDPPSQEFQVEARLSVCRQILTQARLFSETEAPTFLSTIAHILVAAEGVCEERSARNHDEWLSQFSQIRSSARQLVSLVLPVMFLSILNLLPADLQVLESVASLEEEAPRDPTLEAFGEASRKGVPSGEPRHERSDAWLLLASLLATRHARAVFKSSGGFCDEFAQVLEEVEVKWRDEGVNESGLCDRFHAPGEEGAQIRSEFLRTVGDLDLCLYFLSIVSNADDVCNGALADVGGSVPPSLRQSLEALQDQLESAVVSVTRGALSLAAVARGVVKHLALVPDPSSSRPQIVDWRWCGRLSRLDEDGLRRTLRTFLSTSAGLRAASCECLPPRLQEAMVPPKLQELLTSLSSEKRLLRSFCVTCANAERRYRSGSDAGSPSKDSSARRRPTAPSFCVSEFDCPGGAAGADVSSEERVKEDFGDEWSRYEVLWGAVNPFGLDTGYFQWDPCRRFLLKSRLGSEAVSEIVALTLQPPGAGNGNIFKSAQKNVTTDLSQVRFFIALRLVAHVQAGREVEARFMQVEAPQLPAFDGLSWDGECLRVSCALSWFEQ